ncbi:MAG: helix-turn-helix domain-containing protein [Reichenbachiella sp.]
MSDSTENEYFSDGITEEIINALAQIKELKVTSRTSSFHFKNKNEPIADIGATLNVTTVLEGSVRLSGSMMRITAQLIQVKDDFHFWSDTWDRKRENVFEVQDEISIQIADKLREHIGHLEIKEHLVEHQITNVDAYEHILKAKYYKNLWNPSDVKKAITLYEHALSFDDSIAIIYVGIADCYSFLGTTGFIPFEEAWKKTIEYTQKALTIDDSLSEVHYQLANIAFFVECDFTTSLAEMKQAIVLNPNNAEAHQFLSFLYVLAGERELSQKHLDNSVSINPLSDDTQFFRGYFHYMIEEYSTAEKLLKQCLKANDHNIPAHSILYLCYLKLGRYDEVLNYFDTIPQEVIIPGEKLGALALAYALKKDSEKTLEYTALLVEEIKKPNGFTADSYLLMMYVVTHQFDKAIHWIENAIKNKSSMVLLRFADPLMNNLMDDPRYGRLKDILFKGMRKTSPDSHQSEKKDSKRALLDTKATQHSIEVLNKYISENKPYLDPDLSLRSLAYSVGLNPNQLSWLLNTHVGKNFNEYINHYRIEQFKVLAEDTSNAHITLLALAYDAGFNSKTVFNTYFKKETGTTPKQYLKAQ